MSQQIMKVPKDLGKGEAGADTVTIEKYFEEVFDYNKSKSARVTKELHWMRICTYTKSVQDCTPEECWTYIRESTKTDIDLRTKLAVEFLKKYVQFLKVDHPEIQNRLRINDPTKSKRKTYVTKLHNNSLSGAKGACITLMSRIGGIDVPPKKVSDRIMGIPKTVKRGMYDLEEEDGKPLVAEQARFIIESLKDGKTIAACYFMNYSGFRSGEVYNVTVGELKWDEKLGLMKVKTPKIIEKEGVPSKGFRYGTLEVWEKVQSLIEGLKDSDHPFRANENQSKSAFVEGLHRKHRAVFETRADLNGFDKDVGRYEYNVHSWRARCATEYARTQGISDADGYIRHAGSMKQYFKKTPEERVQAFKEASIDLAIYQVDKKEAENKLKDVELSKMAELEKIIRELQAKEKSRAESEKMKKD